MKRVNIYINEETDKLIDNLATRYSKSRSDVMRDAILTYQVAKKPDLEEFGLRHNIPTGLSDEEMSLLKACERFEVFLVHTIRQVFDAQTYIPHVDLVNRFISNESLIINKSRQIGYTTLAGYYMLHSIMYNNSYSVFHGAGTHTINQDIRKRVLDLYSTLPTAFQKAFPLDGNKSHMRCVTTNSVIRFPPATIDFTRGINADLIMFDELVDTSKRHVLGAIDNTYVQMTYGARVIIASTVGARNGTFHAIKAQNVLNPRFAEIEIPWFTIPSRDVEFARNMIDQIGLRAFLIEYACIQLNGDESDEYLKNKYMPFGW